MPSSSVPFFKIEKTFVFFLNDSGTVIPSHISYLSMLEMDSGGLLKGAMWRVRWTHHPMDPSTRDVEKLDDGSIPTQNVL